MEQAVGDQCPLKLLMSGPQWREHAVVSQAAAHVSPLGQKWWRCGLQAAAWPGRTAERLTMITQRVGSPDAPNASPYDSSGKMIFRAHLLSALQLVWLLFRQCRVPCRAGILGERPHHCREHPEHTLRRHPCAPQQSQKIQPPSCLAVYRVHMLGPS